MNQLKIFLKKDNQAQIFLKPYVKINLEEIEKEENQNI